MKFLFALLVLSCPFWIVSTWGQTDFRASLKKADPVPKASDLPLEEKLKIHQAFYDSASQQKNAAHQVYGQVLLALDHLIAQDYAEATRYLLAAEALANANENPGWKGWIYFQKGVVAMRMKNREEAVHLYETAASLCGEAGDSLCLAESLEQASVMYGLLDDFEQAQRINAQAMLLLEKFGGEEQLATAQGNFGIILSLQGRPAEAIPYFERAIALHRKLGNPANEAKTMNNLADAYRKHKRYDLALATFERCIRLNQENSLPGNLIHNYLGIGLTYDSIGDFRTSRIYFEKYEVLKDSLIGAETQRKIAEMQLKFETQQKELELEKSKAALLSARNSLEWRTTIIVVLLLLAALGIWLWRQQVRHAKMQLSYNQSTLADLTQILLEKNKQLALLEEKVSGQSSDTPSNTPDDTSTDTSPGDFEENIFDQNILTDADWAAFKVYFEKAYPGYLHRLRSAFPTMTDAEERLFLFIKLNLTTKEAASMLGISADSVKRTRNRLRKRLELAEDIGLEGYVRAF